MIAKPPGWPFLIVCLAAAAVILEWASYPFWYWFEMFLFAVPVGLLLTVYWAVRVVLSARRGAEMNRLGRWFAPWFVLGGMVLALVTDAPFWIRFTISAPSMEAFAKQVTPLDRFHEQPCQWVGLYQVCGAGWLYTDPDTDLRVPGSAEFQVKDPFVTYGSKGFAWIPFGELDVTSDGRYRHLKDRWYGADWTDW